MLTVCQRVLQYVFSYWLKVWSSTWLCQTIPDFIPNNTENNHVLFKPVSPISLIFKCHHKDCLKIKGDYNILQIFHEINNLINNDSLWHFGLCPKVIHV